MLRVSPVEPPAESTCRTTSWAGRPRATASWATLLRDFSTGYQARNGGGDAIVTDGNFSLLDPTATGSGDKPHADDPDRADRRAPPIIVEPARVATRVVAAVTLAVAMAQARPPRSPIFSEVR